MILCMLHNLETLLPPLAYELLSAKGAYMCFVEVMMVRLSLSSMHIKVRSRLKWAIINTTYLVSMTIN